MIIIKYGGSILNPDGQYDKEAVATLIDLLKAHPHEIFCLIIGGGAVCRSIQDAAEHILSTALPQDLMSVARDEVGIAVTKINAHYVLEQLQVAFKQMVCPELIITPHLRPPEGFRIYVATGERPGHSTDYDMMVLANTFNADKAIKISNFPVVLDVNPTAFDKEKMDSYTPLFEMTWSELQNLVGSEWVPGGNYPFDPAACVLGKKRAFTGFSLRIGMYDQLAAMVAGKDFKGTVVQGR